MRAVKYFMAIFVPSALANGGVPVSPSSFSTFTDPHAVLHSSIGMKAKSVYLYLVTGSQILKPIAYET